MGDDCGSSGGLHLVSYDVSGTVLTRKDVSPLIACAAPQTLPDNHRWEVPYAATAVKWVGPFETQFTVFVARSVTANSYSYHAQCAAGNYILSALCVRCPAGYRCDGKSKTACTAATYQPRTG